MDILSHPEFAAGRTHTGFLADHLTGWRGQDNETENVALIAAGLHDLLEDGGSRPFAGPAHEAGVPPGNPWHQLGRFRIRGLES
jgi:hypothetical protein